MILLTLGSAIAAEATLHVGVHRAAGGIHDVAADGASGQCRVLGMSRLVCPARGPVTFRWGGDEDFALVGQSVVEPGTTGEAFVLPPDGSRTMWRERLADPTLDDVRETFIRTGAREIPIPSRALFGDLVALTAHPSWQVRREAVRGLMPYVRHTSSDPFPADSPTLVPPGVYERLARDPSRQVRRRALQLLKEMQPEDPRAAEAQRVVAASRDDADRRVRKLALVVATKAATEEIRDPYEAWQEALGRVHVQGPTGRAAANALRQLRGRVPFGSVDADRALGLIIEHQPEKAWAFWNAWRTEVPFDAERLLYLLGATVNLSEGLLKRFAVEHPVELAAVVRRWEPRSPHSRRFQVVGRWVDPVAVDPELRAALGLGDTLSEQPDDAGHR
jgi:hypothetical protein